MSRRQPITPPVEAYQPHSYENIGQPGIVHDEPDPFRDLWATETPHTLLVPANSEPGWVRRTVARAADWIDESMVIVGERRQGWGRRAAALGMLAVAQLGVLAEVGIQISEAVGDPTAELALEREVKPASPLQSREAIKPAPEISPEQRLYEASKAVVLATPFKAEFITPENQAALDAAREQLKKAEIASFGLPYSEDAFTPGQRAIRQEYKTAVEKWRSLNTAFEQSAIDQRYEETIQRKLKQYGAKFELATQLSSGIKLNIYSSQIDSTTEPLSVDVKALDVFVNKIIDFAQNIPNSPANAEMVRLAELAGRGAIDLKVDVVLAADEATCLAGQELLGGALISGLKPMNSLQLGNEEYCVANGVNHRLKDAPSRNQLIVALDHGQDSFMPDGQRRATPLDPNQGANRTLGHELTHALLGFTNQNGKLTSDEEHTNFVYPIQERIVTYLVNSTPPGREQISFGLPILVEDDPVRTPPPGMRKIR